VAEVGVQIVGETGTFIPGIAYMDQFAY